MFLEKLGRFFFSNMRPAFFFLLMGTPLALGTLFLSSELKNLNDLEARFSKAARKEKTVSERKGRKERFLARYSNPDPYFIDRKIESFLLLQNEKERLTALLHHPAFPECAAVKDRLFFLNENRFSFAEENIHTSPQVKEIEEKQRHPVQLDEDDLKKILSLLEDLPIDSSTPMAGSPQIVIKNFRLKKLKTPLQTEVFEVQMDLIKREFSKT